MGEKDLARVRSASITVIEGVEETPKRKSGETEGLDKSREGEEVFKRSNKTLRSPKEMKSGGLEEKIGRIEGLLMEMSEENKYRWSKVEEGLMDIRKEIERIKLKEQEWERERDQLKTRLEEVERKLEERKGGEGKEGWVKEMENRVRKLEEGREKGGKGERREEDREGRGEEN